MFAGLKAGFLSSKAKASESQKEAMPRCRSEVPDLSGRCFLSSLPPDIFELIYGFLPSARDLCNFASCCKEVPRPQDDTWQRLYKRVFPLFYTCTRLEQISQEEERQLRRRQHEGQEGIEKEMGGLSLDAKEKRQEEAVSWHEIYKATLQGKHKCRVQVFNREREKPFRAEFYMSCYEAIANYEHGRSRQKGRQVYHVVYLPDGRGVIEEYVGTDVMRPPVRLPPPSRILHDPMTIYPTPASVWNEVKVGDFVEIQWKQQEAHPFGWWFGEVEERRHDELVIVFRHYMPISPWYRVHMPIGNKTQHRFLGGWLGALRQTTPESQRRWERFRPAELIL